MLKLYRFHWDVGDRGDIASVFVADDEKVSAAIGKTVYFGEVLGKHSDITGTLEENDLKILSEDQTFILKAQECGLVPLGYNPLNYMEA